MTEKITNREQILSKAQNKTLKTMEVFVSDWDTKVIVKELSGKQFIDISINATKNDIMNRTEFLNRAIIATTYDLESKKIFKVSNIDLVERMGADSYSQLVTAITVLNNLTGEAKNKSKNSGQTN